MQDRHLAVAGVGTSMCFPTVANAVSASVPPEDVSVATGTNVALRELGGVFGIAIAAAVFAHDGSYADQASFIRGFKPALMTAAALAAAGLVAAVPAPGRKAARPQAGAGAGDPVEEGVLVGPER